MRFDAISIDDSAVQQSRSFSLSFVSVSRLVFFRLSKEKRRLGLGLAPTYHYYYYHYPYYFCHDRGGA